MRKMIAYSALLASFICLVMPTQASANWHQLVNRLMLEGIQPHEVDWRTVNILCGGVQQQRQYYHECRLEKAVTQARHQQDRRVCKRLTDRPTVTIRRNRHKNHPLLKQNLLGKLKHRRFHPHGLRRNNHSNRHQYGERALETCMNNRGWQDSRRWR